MLSVRPLLPAMLSFAVALGCSSASEAPAEPETATSPVLPAEEPVAAEPLPPAKLAPSPSCGAPGTRVVLRLDWTSDKRVPECMRPDEFEVRFGTTPAKITMLGPTSDGYCALDVVVPPKAESAVVTVKMRSDVFVSANDFGVPCRR